MKTKHTQGPWEIDGAEIYGAKDKDGSQRLIARIDYDANGKKELSEEDWANARLIASAPELLNHLKIITDLVIGNDHVTRACNDALRIIKKIEGEL